MSRLLVSLLSLLLCMTSCNKETSKVSEDTSMQNAAKEFENAFNKHDARVLALLWTKDASHVNPVTGEELQGRDEIQKYYEDYFKEHPDEKITITVKKIIFPAPFFAVEVGSSKVVDKEGNLVRETVYRAELKKENGQWLLQKIREEMAESAISHYENLKEIAWLAGNWIDSDEDTDIEINASFDFNKNFLIQHFKAFVLNQETIYVRQVIGWDPRTENIRSWIFDSDGGFGRGIWNRIGDEWSVNIHFIMPDGRKASAINIYKKIDDNSYTWSSIGRDIDGDILPDVGPVTVIRKNGAKNES